MMVHESQLLSGSKRLGVLVAALWAIPGEMGVDSSITIWVLPFVLFYLAWVALDWLARPFFHQSHR